jgi:uncharacterized membrane protein
VALDPTAIAVLFALACSTFWALANVYVQRAGRALGSLRALLYSQGIGSAVLLPFAWTFDAPLSAPALPDLVLTAAGSALGYYAMMEAFARGSLSGVVPMITAWAVPAAVAGVMWTGEWPGVQAAIGGAMIVVGAVGNGLLAPVPDGQRGTDRVALGWAAASALGFGVMVAGTARLRPALGDVGVVPAVWLAQWLLLLPLLLRTQVVGEARRERVVVVGRVGLGRIRRQQNSQQARTLPEPGVAQGAPDLPIHVSALQRLRADQHDRHRRVAQQVLAEALPGPLRPLHHDRGVSRRPAHDPVAGRGEKCVPVQLVDPPVVADEDFLARRHRYPWRRHRRCRRQSDTRSVPCITIIAILTLRPGVHRAALGTEPRALAERRDRHRAGVCGRPARWARPPVAAEDRAPDEVTLRIRDPEVRRGDPRYLFHGRRRPEPTLERVPSTIRREGW